MRIERGRYQRIPVGIKEFQRVSTANNEVDMFAKKLSDQSTINMLQGCLGMTSTTKLCKTDSIMSEGECQELQSAQDWKRTTGVKTQRKLGYVHLKSRR